MPVKKIFHSSAVLLSFLFFATALNARDIYPPKFTNPPQNNVDAGHIKLIWEIDNDKQIPEGRTFELQQSTDSLFKKKLVIYEGPDLATFISGLQNGIYYYRIRAIDKNNVQSDWSESLLVNVQHHSLSMAFTLFGIGAVVFLLTMLVVLMGSKTSNKLNTEAA